MGSYLIWHYSAAFSGILRVWSNFLWFFYHFFSIPILFTTLFSPWKKIHEEKSVAGFSLQEAASTFIVNTLMRVVGFFFRVALISFGLVSIFIVGLLGVIVFILWIIAPVLVIALFITGIIFLFK